jgi:hypothetical protein
MARKTAKADMTKVDRDELQKVVDVRRNVVMDINRIHPNKVNRNKMGTQYMAALKASMVNPHVAFTIPILVRPDPQMVAFDPAVTYTPEFLEELVSTRPDVTFEIIDGEHRWKAAKEIGYQRIPVVVFPPIPDSLAAFIMLESNQVRGATKDEDLHAVLESIYSSEDSWMDQVDDDLHTMLVMDPKISDADKYDLGDVDVENDHPAATPVTMFFSDTQRERFRKIVGQLRLVHGITNEEAVMMMIEHFETSTGFGTIPKETEG